MSTCTTSVVNYLHGDNKMKIQVGDIYSFLEVKEILPSEGAGTHRKIKCLCKCGNITIKQSHNFMKHQMLSCGCQRQYWNNLINKVFGKLKVDSLVKSSKESNNQGHQGHTYKCVCVSCNKEYTKTTAMLSRPNFVGCPCDIMSLKKAKYCSYIGQAKSRKLEFSLSLDEFTKLSEQECYYCGNPHSNIKSNKYCIWNHNGIDRIDNNIGYIVSNCRPCCRYCNMAKSDMQVNEFIDLCKRVASRN